MTEDYDNPRPKPHIDFVATYRAPAERRVDWIEVSCRISFFVMIGFALALGWHLGRYLP